MNFIKLRRIISPMIDFAKRWGPYFLTAFVVLLGLALQAIIQNWSFLDDYRTTTTIILFILAMTCLLITIIALIYDVKDARRKDRETKNSSNEWPKAI